jgi:hypothetical protein
VTLAVLETLFSNNELCTEFPFIGFAKRSWSAGAGAAPAGCGSCGKKPSREQRQHLLETVKASIVSLPPDRVARLKELLNTDKLVLHFAVRGQTVTKEI